MLIAKATCAPWKSQATSSSIELKSGRKVNSKRGLEGEPKAWNFERKTGCRFRDAAGDEGEIEQKLGLSQPDDIP
jgi:hypothetical protein